MTTSPSEYPLDLSQILAEEYAALRQDLPKPLQQRLAKIALVPPKERPTVDPTLLQDLYSHIHRSGINQTALCFSGGGIRSATFNLGVIQALAKLNLLDTFDYLSTVSGGGYIGAWLTAWTHRLTRIEKESTEAGESDQSRPEDKDTLSRKGITAVQALLRNGDTNRHAQPSCEPAPLSWLREYSNYLTPSLGFFSADSWTMIGTALRNLILNWLVLVPLLVAAFMIPRFHIAIVQHTPQPDTLPWLLGPGLFLAFPALFYLHYYRPSMGKQRCLPSDNAGNNDLPSTWNFEAQGWFICLCLVPLLATSYLLTTAWAWHRNTLGSLESVTLWSLSVPATFVLIGCLLHLLPWLAAMLWQLRYLSSSTVGTFLLWRGGEALFIALSGCVGGWLLWAILDTGTKVAALPTQSNLIDAPLLMMVMVKEYAEWYAAFAVPGFLGIFLLVATLFIGVTSRFTGDHDHEFWGRTGSWMLNAGTVLTGMSALVIFGPGWMVKVGAWTSAAVGGIAGVLSIVGGFSAKTLLAPSEKQDRVSWLTELGVKAATPLFAILLIVGLALGTSFLVKGWAALQSVHTTATWKATGQWMPEPYENGPWTHSLALHNVEPVHLLTLWLLLLLIGSVMGFCVNVNKFSLHGFYRNRLIRAYLGASRDLAGLKQRKPNLLTGFDLSDNIYMTELAGHTYDDENQRPAKKSQDKPPIQRPFHVVNIALNLVRADKLAWQQRKAQSFTVSPLHCGSWQHVGYRHSHEYGYNAGVKRAISLGTAIATSGAAASPNMGYHSSASVTFLLALFNIRLGWWIGNPGEAGNHSFLGRLGKVFKLWPTYSRSHPAFSIGPLVAELFGLTNSSRRYVYLSDGGHFENLALYEMVLRRCHHIVVVDAGCDPDMSFQDLGNAIRKIRIDLGVDIEIDTDMLKPQGGSRLSRWHHVIGRIRYDKVDTQAPIGTLIYLKPSLSGNEPSDVQDYAAHHPAFPHEPTSDQFFDEAQFESYRRLGQHIATDVFQVGALPGDTRSSTGMFDDVISRLQKHWVPTPPGIQDSFLREAQTLLEIEKQLHTDPRLARYDGETYPELLSVFGVDPKAIDQLDVRSSLHACYSQIQLMENVFLGVRLDAHYAHPLNRGWMNLFRRWAGAKTFRQWWPVLCGTFSPAFVEFSERHLSLSSTSQFVYQRQPLPQPVIDNLRALLDQEWTADPALPDLFTKTLRNPAMVHISPEQPVPAVWIAYLGSTTTPHALFPFPEGELIGVVCLSPENQQQWQMHGWIKSSYREVGIGYRLFTQALADMRASLAHSGTDTMTLCVDLGPDSASQTEVHHERTAWIQFYERLGFRRGLAEEGTARRLRLCCTIKRDSSTST